MDRELNADSVSRPADGSAVSMPVVPMRIFVPATLPADTLQELNAITLPLEQVHHLQPIEGVVELAVAVGEDREAAAAAIRALPTAEGRPELRVLVLAPAEVCTSLLPLDPRIVDAGPVNAGPVVIALAVRRGMRLALFNHSVAVMRQDRERLKHEMKELEAVGIALSSERSLSSLLKLILTNARLFSRADAGSIWVTERTPEGVFLRNAVSQNHSIPLEHHEFRVPIDPRSVAGWVASSGEVFCCDDVYDLPTDGEPSSSGSRSFDAATGYRTASMLALPMFDPNAEPGNNVLGVVQLMNCKRRVGSVLSPETLDEVVPFDEESMQLMRSLAGQASIALANANAVESVQQESRRSQILLDVMRTFSEHLDLETLLQEIMRKTREVMDADRCTLFLVDEQAGELWSKVGQGLEGKSIRFPKHLGIAGHVATTPETVNIPDAYADPRFNREIDRATGYRTRNILCMPVIEDVRRDDGTVGQRVLGVTQVLNKRIGSFEPEDERLLAAVSSQAAVALKNAQLFQEVMRMKNYNESILRSISTGVITLNADGTVTGVNPAASRLFELGPDAVGQHFGSAMHERRNTELVTPIHTALSTNAETRGYDVSAVRPSGDSVRLDLTVLPLVDETGANTGLVVAAQDITAEKRLMSSLSRYVSREVAERLIREPQKLGGVTQEVAVLFSDIRSYTTLTENSTAHEIVGLLNAYFSRMVPIIFRYRGMLDKFIGDAIMAVYGALDPHEHVPDYIVWSAIEMRRMLRLHNAERHLQGALPIETGIGVGLGMSTYGNIGSEERMDVTVIGDAVNVAARLESLTKETPANILATAPLVARLHDSQIPWMDLGTIPIKGKAEPLQVYGIPDSYIFGELELPSIVVPERTILPDLTAPLADLARRLDELLDLEAQP